MSMNINTGGLPLLSLNQSRSIPSAEDQAVYPAKSGIIHIGQLYRAANPRYRIAREGFEQPVFIVEMTMHSPASQSQYQISRVWLAVHAEQKIAKTGDRVDNNTSAPLVDTMFNNLQNPINALITTGNLGMGLVPSITWNQELDVGKPEKQLIQEGKLTLSHIILGFENGIVPAVTYDHTATLGNPYLDYENIRVNYGAEGQEVPRLRSHPTVNTVHGYCAVDPAKPVSKFFETANVQTGLLETNGRQRFAFIAKTFANGRDSKGCDLLFELHDNFIGDTSRAALLHSEIVPNIMNEMEVSGSLRVGNVRNSTACLFRVQINSWTKKSIESAVVSASTTEADLGFLNNPMASGVMETVAEEAVEDESLVPFDTDETIADTESNESLADLTSDSDIDVESDEDEDGLEALQS